YLENGRDRRARILARRLAGSDPPRAPREPAADRGRLRHFAARPGFDPGRARRCGRGGLGPGAGDRASLERARRARGARRARARAEARRQNGNEPAGAGRMSVEDWRRKIDEIDRKLVELLNERSRCVLEIGRLKRQDGSPLYQPDREREVLDAAERANRGPLSEAAIRRLFERILDEARSVERTEMRDD